MCRRVNVLEVEHHEVGRLHETLKFDEPRRILCEGQTARIERGVDAFGFGQFEEFNQKVDLQEGLSAAYRDAALFAPVWAVAQRHAKHFGSRLFFTGMNAPSIRIVAVDAAHPAALHEDHKPDAGAVNGPEGFVGMYAAERHSSDLREGNNGVKNYVRRKSEGSRLHCEAIKRTGLCQSFKRSR